jgi:hypothetical protein
MSHSISSHSSLEEIGNGMFEELYLSQKGRFNWLDTEEVGSDSNYSFVYSEGSSYWEFSWFFLAPPGTCIGNSLNLSRTFFRSRYSDGTRAWSGSIFPTILDLCTRWKSVVSFTPRPLYPRVRSFWYLLDRRLDGSERQSGHCGEEKNLLSLPGIEPRSTARNLSFYRLNYPGFSEWGIMGHAILQGKQMVASRLVAR